MMSPLPVLQNQSKAQDESDSQMIPENDIIRLFSIPLVHLDNAFRITSVNEAFEAAFGQNINTSIAELSDNFNARKCARKFDNHQTYKCQLSGKTTQDIVYDLLIRPVGDGYIAIALDASYRIRADAMLESYSQMMENKVASLTREAEKLEKMVAYYKALATKEPS
ncbi:MAG: hypothetical protein ACON49_09845 [Candidatus Puniceispirillaceae bacterium]